MTRRLICALVAIGVLAAGCGSGTGETREPAPGSSGQVSGQVVVFAAASLTESFRRLGREFEDEHPGTRVTFSFGGSSTLGPQITSGAPADVFAAADRRTMSAVVEAGGTSGKPSLFARNRLLIAVPEGNPAGIEGIEDFARPELALAVCAPEVPCGAAAERAFAAAGVTARPDTLEQDVKSVLTKVRLGEADAGMVYRTDVRAAGENVDGVPFPEADEAVNDYLIAGIADAPNPAGARAFVDFVQSGTGREVLADAGFDLP